MVLIVMKIKPIVILSALSAATALPGADWPCFGGSGRDFVSSEQGLVVKWGDQEPKKLWQANIGAGYSSIVVGGGLAYAVGHEGSKNAVRCLDAKTGGLIWKYEY
ncbi:uncharacterized protein METZ01_LOCUS470100, partial [marine metagenome]